MDLKPPGTIPVLGLLAHPPPFATCSNVHSSPVQRGHTQSRAFDLDKRALNHTYSK